ncbi:hypothetical protein NQ176_g10497 [Zarea fungicola]|uniref:Uncharacterized protein n=1 Tax=Zarea fungicola TaxID=93591 RepID=A0ACC1MGB7_9HYPO|nr:hypothetical protein NQ176_g10497 [Lecanicillium fungicola]
MSAAPCGGAIGTCSRLVARSSLGTAFRCRQTQFRVPQNTRTFSNQGAESNTGSREHKKPQKPLQARLINPAVAAIVVIIGGTVYYLNTPSPQDKFLNQDSFVPYVITAREAISPSSFIFTVSPQHPNSSPSYLKNGPPGEPAQWRYPLWSVEFKQPEVQIARNYTPLPPLEGETSLEDGKLRFYVRSIPGGEMSSYLGRLGVGREVWLRGTHPGFDVETRLGAQNNVVFLAGGTGIAPAMQVARAEPRGATKATGWSDEAAVIGLLVEHFRKARLQAKL